MWPETRSRKRRGSNRRDTRVALEARAQGRTFPAQLYDISPTGCRFDCEAWDLARGERVVFKFAEEIKVAGTVAWRRRGSAGVQFDAPLPEAISRHLRFDGPGAADEE
jgi:hypothetical protein